MTPADRKSIGEAATALVRADDKAIGAHAHIFSRVLFEAGAQMPVEAAHAVIVAMRACYVAGREDERESLANAAAREDALR